MAGQVTSIDGLAGRVIARAAWAYGKDTSLILFFEDGNYAYASPHDRGHALQVSIGEPPSFEARVLAGLVAMDEVDGLG